MSQPTTRYRLSLNVRCSQTGILTPIGQVALNGITAKQAQNRALKLAKGLVPGTIEWMGEWERNTYGDRVEYSRVIDDGRTYFTLKVEDATAELAYL